MAFCRTMVNLWKGNLAIASRSNSSRNSMTVPERCSCISSFGSPFSLVLEELMRVHLRAGWRWGDDGDGCTVHEVRKCGGEGVFPSAGVGVGREGGGGGGEGVGGCGGPR